MNFNQAGLLSVLMCFSQPLRLSVRHNLEAARKPLAYERSYRLSDDETRFRFTPQKQQGSKDPKVTCSVVHVASDQ